jgi:hypothetical protein
MAYNGNSSSEGYAWLSSGSNYVQLVTAKMKVTDGCGLFLGSAGYDFTSYNNGFLFVFKKVSNQMMMVINAGVWPGSIGSTRVEQPCPFTEDAFVDISFQYVPDGVVVGYRSPSGSGDYKNIMKLSVPRGSSTGVFDPAASLGVYGGAYMFKPAGTPEYERLTVWQHKIKSKPEESGGNPLSGWADNFDRADGAYNPTTASGYNSSRLVVSNTTYGHNITSSQLAMTYSLESIVPLAQFTPQDNYGCDLEPVNGIGWWLSFKYVSGSVWMALLFGGYKALVYVNSDTGGSSQYFGVATGEVKFEENAVFDTNATAGNTWCHLICYVAPGSGWDGYDPEVLTLRAYNSTGTNSMPSYGTTPKVTTSTTTGTVRKPQYYPLSGIAAQAFNPIGAGTIDDVTLSSFNVQTWTGTSFKTPVMDMSADPTARVQTAYSPNGQGVSSRVYPVANGYRGTKLNHELVEAGT